MRRILVFMFIMLFSTTSVFAYAMKVYDEYGNRVGTYRKEGDKYQLYDFNDQKVDDPENLIKEPPDQKTLKEYSRTLYDQNMMPIGTYRSGLYGSNGRYYPRGYYVPNSWYPMNNNYIVRPNANNVIRYNKFNYPRPTSTIFVPTRMGDPFANTILKF